jgi:hypothetical protein
MQVTEVAEVAEKPWWVTARPFTPGGRETNATLS